MNITKRDFIKIGGGAALAGAAFPSFAAKSAKPSYGGRKVRIAAIGTGGMARGDLNNFLRSGLAEVVCAADVYAPSLDWLRKAQPKAKFYKDYRKMLAECAGTFDAVTIVVPDHSHCVAKKAGIITQVGMQGNSFPTTQSLREWMESGELGQAREAHLYCNSVRYFYCDPPEFFNTHVPVPAGLDWDLWQGPAVRRPYFRDTGATGTPTARGA